MGMTGGRVLGGGWEEGGRRDDCKLDDCKRGTGGMENVREGWEDCGGGGEEGGL